MKTIKQFSESKAAEKGERDVGSKAYTDYVTDLTPGAVSNADAKKSDRETKKTNALKIHRATRLDDATDPEVEAANKEYELAKKQLQKKHIQNVANIRANKIGENLVPDPVAADAYNYKTKKGAIAAPGSGSIAKARKAKASDTNKSIEQQMADARKEGWEELDPSDVLIEYENEEVEEDATYSERISKPVPAGNASKARGTSKVRKYRQVTPGQVRDYEKLTATRMFQAYEESEVEEDAPANATGPAIANWDPLLGGNRSPRVYVRKRRKTRLDARSRDYREAVKRTQARRDAVAAREAEHKLNMFGVQSNPFKEETEMKNKKYLTIKEGSLESAVVKSVGTETPVNPNDARPTLHLPNKYLASKTGSLEKAVTEVMTERDVSGEMRFDIKRLTGPQFRRKYSMTKQAAMTPGGGITHKGGKAVLHHEYEPEGTEIDEKGKQHPGQKKGTAKLKKGWGMTQSGEPYFKPSSNNPTRDKKDEEVEVDETHAPGHDQKSSIGTPLKHKRSWNPATHKLVQTPTGSKVVKKDDPKHKGAPEHESVEMEAKDSRRTVDAIRAYDKSKDASRDADWDTEHGKKGKGDKEKKYAKKERGEIDKDDPDWKHKKYHTGMHGEERSAADAALLDKAKRRHAQDKRERDTEKLPAPKSEEMNPLIQATVNELSKKTLGRYVKKASHSAVDSAMALQRSSDKPSGQTYKDVEKHAGKVVRRQAGISKATDKLSKEEVEIDEDKLSYKERQNLPKGAFALPGKGSGPEGKQGGSYPIPDESHARNALARVSQHGSEAEKATVRRAVHKKFPDIKVSESVMRDLLTVELDETHSPKDRTALDKAIKSYQDKGGKTTVLKPGKRLTGMEPSRKAVIKARKSNEDVEIDEARSVESAMSIISSIVKNKQAGEIIHGDRKKSKVDLYSASAIQQVYNALNKKNQEKMEKVISKNRQGLAKMADFSMSMMK